MIEFVPFPKVPRLSREVVVTEKIDGTNAGIHVYEDRYDLGPPVVPGSTRVSTSEGEYYLVASSRKRFIAPENDNFGFAAWVRDNAEELVDLGLGSHFGEWWGKGIQRGYSLDHRRFSLFNTNRWADQNVDIDPDIDKTFAPECCHVVPVLGRGDLWDGEVFLPDLALDALQDHGSLAVPGYDNPEGIMIYHTAANQIFKKTFEGDDMSKWERS